LQKLYCCDWRAARSPRRARADNTGGALRYLNRFGEALPHLEQSLAIHQEIGDPFSTSITQITLA
jgi:hypothetical protein